MYKTSVILIVVFITLTRCEQTLKEDSDSLEKSEVELSNYLQKIEATPTIPIVGDIVVLQQSELVPNETARGSEDIVERCARFLSTRELKIRLPTSEARDLLSGSRSKKIRRVLLPLLLLLKLKAAIILPIILSVIALVSFKGFGLSLAALAVAGTTALKNILEHAGSKVSYEVVSAPVGHWSRSGVGEGSIPAAYQYE